MKHKLKLPKRLPAGGDPVRVVADLVPVGSDEPVKTLSFTTFADAWAVRLVDEVSNALSAPLLWVGWRDESRDPPRTWEVPVAPSVFGVEGTTTVFNDNLNKAVVACVHLKRYFTVGTGADTYIVDLSISESNAEHVQEPVGSVELATLKRRIRDEF